MARCTPHKVCSEFTSRTGGTVWRENPQGPGWRGGSLRPAGRRCLRGAGIPGPAAAGTATSLAATRRQTRLRHLRSDTTGSGGEAAPGSAGRRTRALLTLVHVDVVLPLLLVTCAMVPGPLHDVGPVSDVVSNRHLFQAAVRVPDGSSCLTDLGEDSHVETTFSFLLPAP